MKVILLTNNPNSKPILDFLLSKGNDVVEISEQITVEMIKKVCPDFVISYNYRYIVRKEVIDLVRDRIINMHVSLLPWNRGADPNVWSFIDDTPKGVTIHKLSEELDGGDILLQQTVSFDDTEDTLASSYEKLHKTIQALFFENWEQLRDGMVVPYQVGIYGTCHKLKEFEAIRNTLGNNFSWDMKICDFIEDYRKILGV